MTQPDECAWCGARPRRLLTVPGKTAKQARAFMICGEESCNRMVRLVLIKKELGADVPVIEVDL